jgi:hypothetical protein
MSQKAGSFSSNDVNSINAFFMIHLLDFLHLGLSQFFKPIALWKLVLLG